MIGAAVWCIPSTVNRVKPLQAAAPRSAADEAADIIRGAIIDGRLTPGQELREQDLAQQLGISRTPVREALLALQADGLIETTRSRVARVRVANADQLMDMYELRAVIEGYTARRAADRITPAQVETLWNSCDNFAAQRGAEDVIPLVKENLRFHAIVHDASQSARAPGLVRGLLELPLLYRAYAWYTPERCLLSEEHHRGITLALERADRKGAEALMIEHILDAGRAALQALDETDVAPAGPADLSQGPR